MPNRLIAAATVVLSALLQTTALAQPAALAGNLKRDAQACEALAASREAAAYEPGTSARGTPVVPAEGPDAVDAPPAFHSFGVDLTIDLAKRLGAGDDGRLFGSDMALGAIDVIDGEVFLDADRLDRLSWAQPRGAAVSGCRPPKERRPSTDFTPQAGQKRGEAIDGDR